MSPEYNYKNAISRFISGPKKTLKKTLNPKKTLNRKTFWVQKPTVKMRVKEVFLYK